MIHIEKNTLTAPQFHTLYTAVGWDAPEICQIERALTHSMAVFSAYDDADPSCPVGMVRLLGDGGMSFYLKDFAVLPSYQHNGIGSLLMEAGGGDHSCHARGGLGSLPRMHQHTGCGSVLRKARLCTTPQRMGRSRDVAYAPKDRRRDEMRTRSHAA